MRTLLAPLTVVLVLTACVAASAAAALAEWVNGPLLTIMPLLAVVEAGIAYQVVTTLPKSYRRRVRIAELLSLVVAANVGHFAAMGWTAARAELTEWPVAIFQFETFAVAIATYAAWRATTTSLRALRSIDDGIEPWDIERERPTLPYSKLWGLFLSGGMALLVLESVATIGLRNIFDWERDLAQGVLIATLIYFPLGLWAMGRVRLNAGRTHWSARKIPVIGNLRSRWNVLLAASVAAALLLTAIVPVGGSSMVVRLAAAIVGWVQGVLLTPSERTSPAAVEVVTTTAPTGEAGPGSPPASDGIPRLIDWNWQIPRAVWIGLFWLVVVAGIVYVAWTFFGLRSAVARLFRPSGERELSFGGLRTGLGALADALVRVFRRVFRFAETAREGLQDRRSARTERKRSPGEPGSHDIQPRPGKSPRRRIGDLYEGFLDEAGKLVVPRQASETPDEYRRDVELVVPAVGPHLGELTEVFNEARYSLHPMRPDHVERAADAVRQLGTLLTEYASAAEHEPSNEDPG